MSDHAEVRRFILEELRGGARDETAQKAWKRRSKLCPIQRPMKDRWPA